MPSPSMAPVEKRMTHRHLLCLLSTFDACEVDFVHHMNRYNAKKIGGKTTRARNTKHNTWSQKKTNFARSQPRQLATHLVKDFYAQQSLNWLAQEAQDDSEYSHRRAQKVLKEHAAAKSADQALGIECMDDAEGAERRLEKPQVRFGMVVVVEVDSYKEAMKQLNETLSEGIRHIECDICKARAAKTDMCKVDKVVWHCEICNVASKERKLQFFDTEVHNDSYATQSTPQKQDERLPPLSENFLGWAVGPMPSRKWLKSSSSFRQLKSHLAYQDCDIDPVAWCMSVQAEISEIVGKNIPRKSTLLLAQRLVTQRDRDCLPLLISLASEYASMQDPALSCQEKRGIAAGAHSQEKPRGSSGSSPPVAPRKKATEIVQSWEELFDL